MVTGRRYWNESADRVERRFAAVHMAMRVDADKWFYLPYISRHAPWLQVLDLGEHSAWQLQLLVDAPGLTFPTLEILELEQPFPGGVNDTDPDLRFGGDFEADILRYACYHSQLECHYGNCRCTPPLYRPSIVDVIMVRLECLVREMLTRSPRLQVVSTPSTDTQPIVHYQLIFFMNCDIRVVCSCPSLCSRRWCIARI